MTGFHSELSCMGAIMVNPFKSNSLTQKLIFNPYFCQKKTTDSDNLYFNGSSLVRLDLLRDPISAARETIRFRFKTTHPNGVLLYSRGTQGDYIAVQLKENRLVLNVNLGSNIPTTLQVGSLLDDNIWHDVIVSRNRRDIIFSVDRVVVQGRVKGEFDRLNLNRGVSTTF